MKAANILVGLVLIASAGWAQNGNQSQQSSDNVGKLLAGAKSAASLLSSDVETLDFFMAERAGTTAQASILNVYRDHIAAIRNYASRLEEARKEGSPAQQSAIDRMIPVLEEFAKSADTAMDVARNTGGQLDRAGVREYLKQSGDLGAELSGVVAGWADYAVTKDTLDRISSKQAALSGR